MSARMLCWHCGSEMIWGSDATYEDHGIDDEEGVVSYFSCSAPECACTAHFFCPG